MCIALRTCSWTGLSSTYSPFSNFVLCQCKDIFVKRSPQNFRYIDSKNFFSIVRPSEFMRGGFFKTYAVFLTSNIGEGCTNLLRARHTKLHQQFSPIVCLVLCALLVHICPIIGSPSWSHSSCSIARSFFYFDSLAKIGFLIFFHPLLPARML